MLPLGAGQAVSIALTSYDGGVYFGVNADRDAVPDVGELADVPDHALAELVRASRAARPDASAGAGVTGTERRRAARWSSVAAACSASPGCWAR